MPDKVLQIGLLWHSVNSENLGVTALTFANIAIVEQVAAELGVAVGFTVLSWKDAGAAQLEAANISVFAMRAKDLVRPGGLFERCRRCDMILDISAGDSFADIYGTFRFSLNILAKAVAAMSGTHLILPPQTIGPFDRWWTRRAARFLMRRAKVVMTRDRLSTGYCRNLGIPDAVEATDVAFMLPYRNTPRDGGGTIKVGLNLSGLLFNGGHTRNNMFALKCDYPALARRLIARFLALENCELHLVSHVISDRNETEDDFRVAVALAKEFPAIKLAPRFRTPVEAKTYISNLDFFSGSRMHACIAAFSSGVPVVPMAYSRKFSGLFGTLGYTAVADCRTQTEAEIVDMVLEGYRNRAGLKVKVDTGRAMAMHGLKAYLDILRAELRAAASRAA